MSFFSDLIKVMFPIKAKTKEAKEKYSGWCKAVADLERNCEKQ